MLRLARVLIAMAVLLWGHTAGGGNDTSMLDETLAPTYTTGLIWLGSTSYYINKSIGAADTEKKSVPKPSSLGLRDFQYRFEWNQRAMRDGLLRASGVEYVWVVEKLLEVAPVKQDVFRCKILRERSTLKALLAQAEPGSTANVYDWLVLISQRVENEQDPSNRC
jgi:hypothetical protein